MQALSMSASTCCESLRHGRQQARSANLQPWEALLVMVMMPQGG